MLDLLSPVSLLKNVIQLDKYPQSPHIAYSVRINDADLRYFLIPTGSRTAQILIFTFLAAIPILTALAGAWAYQSAFYAVKFNRVGQTEKRGFLPVSRPPDLHLERWIPEKISKPFRKRDVSLEEDPPGQPGIDQVTTIASRRRRTVLIATMEYDIEDWAIKIKIGGLGVMAQLMSKHLQHEDLVWIVPCMGGVDYPVDQRAKPMTVTILGVEYTIQVQVRLTPDPEEMSASSHLQSIITFDQISHTYCWMPISSDNRPRKSRIPDGWMIWRVLSTILLGMSLQASQELLPPISPNTNPIVR